MENTEILKLPYIMPSQAQKHVTHNEAIRQLDALIQLSVVSMDIAEPPTAPDAGARYIVGNGASGDWAGLDGKVVAFLDGHWTAFDPLVGWLAYVQDTEELVLRSQTNWEAIPVPNTLENMEGIGVGAQPDATNKLIVASAASLFSHAGNGHQLKINKDNEAQSASLLFQSNWSGHAEFGLLGSNDFQFKVSNDGSTFLTAIQIAKSTGQVQFPNGVETRSRINFSGRWTASSDNRWVTFSANHGAGNGEFDTNAGTGSAPMHSTAHFGPLMLKGSRIDRFLSWFMSSHAEVNAINIQLVFQYGPPDQPWTESNIQTDTIYAGNGFAVLHNAFTKHQDSISEYICPEDGFALMYVQPLGTISATRYIHSSTIIELISA